MFTEKQLRFKTIKYLITAVVTIIFAIILISFVSNKINRDAQALRQKARIVKLSENRNANTTALKKQLEPWGDVDAQIQSAFPTSDNILDFVASLDTLADRLRVQQTIHFEIPNPSVATEDLQLSSVNYTATFTASANVLANYLEDFESLPFFTDIYTITTTSNDGWDKDSLVNIKAKLYIRNK